MLSDLELATSELINSYREALLDPSLETIQRFEEASREMEPVLETSLSVLDNTFHILNEDE